MSYATQADMETRFGAVELAQLSDRVNGEVIDSDVLTRALADAEAEINGYLAGRYALPLANVPPMLTRLACDMARYFLYDDRVTEAVRNRYADAVKILRAVADGSVVLDGSAALEASHGGNEAMVVPSSRPTVFGRPQ